ncbi:FtsX-like permease family protein [Fulvivirga sp. 29W222]|uniref:FtsX-like permease family protein n=1 Tax=Fulvivirga marina TaxID=2494733 RepID=A0A937KDP6_9BACT|nr:FtsX-like permease family protein [Fulvivirga marina]MBL6446285.1 FtsX-like permease family protein [Fulvivirga marina]
MFWNHCIISLRKLRQHILFYIVSISVSAIGFACLISSFVLFKTYGQVSVFMVGIAVTIFASNSVNSISYKYSIKEVSIRKLLGADSLAIYKLILTESFILSVLALLFSLIALDLAPLKGVFSFNLKYNLSSFGDLVFAFVCVLVVSITTVIFPGYRLVKADIISHLKKN